MKLGIIARAEDRGIGIQTWEAVRHLNPERVLVVDVQNPDGFELHLDRYPGATVARLQAGRWLAETLVREWMDDLDVVFTVETLYDWRIADWARDQGVATVVQANPEMLAHRPGWHEAAPTVWWNPTRWRMNEMPTGTIHVPVPVATDRFEPRQLDEEPRRLRALHVVGRPALGDRNGTEIVQTAAKLTKNVDWTIRAQKRTDRAPHAEGEVPDYWKLYRGQDVLVMPRRYGGLCLPVQEACAAGVIPAMPTCPPNLDWPIYPLDWTFRGTIAVPAGELPMVETDPKFLAAALDRIADNPELRATMQQEASRWAYEHSWRVLAPQYLTELQRAVEVNAQAYAP